jgi:hypothetical protein
MGGGGRRRRRRRGDLGEECGDGEEELLREGGASVERMLSLLLREGAALLLRLTRARERERERERQ